jgi:opacity protein-like surface antigen
VKRIAIAALVLALSASAAFADPPATQWSLVLAMGNNTFIVGGYSSEAKCEEGRAVTGKTLRKAKAGRAFCIEIKNGS